MSLWRSTDIKRLLRLTITRL